jgi:hypothetical protein
MDVGLKRLGDGVGIQFYKGVVCRIFGWRGFKHSDFETRWTQAIKTPSPRQQQHDNQRMDERVGAQVGGLYGRPFGPPLFTMYFLSKHGEKKGWLGGGSNHALIHNKGNWTIYYLPTQTYFS